MRRHQRNQVSLVPSLAVRSETRTAARRGTDIPHCQGCPGKAAVFVFTANLHPCLWNSLSARSREDMKRAGENLDDVERMRGERGDGTCSSGRAAVQRCRNEGSRRSHHGGSFILYGLVKHHEQTRIGRVAQRRSQESTKELRRPPAYYGRHRRHQGAVRMEVTLQRGTKEKRVS